MFALAETAYDYSYSTSSSSTLSPGVSIVLSLVYLAVGLLAVVALWKIFTKAGKPGWAAIVPFYNIYVMLQIAGRPGWWMLFYFIPFVNIVIQLVVAVDIAKAFGKSTAYGIFGLGIFSIVGYPMLAFGSATYQGASSSAPVAPSQPAPSPAAPTQTPPTQTPPAAPQA